MIAHPSAIVERAVQQEQQAAIVYLDFHTNATKIGALVGLAALSWHQRLLPHPQNFLPEASHPAPEPSPFHFIGANFKRLRRCASLVSHHLIYPIPTYHKGWRFHNRCIIHLHPNDSRSPVVSHLPLGFLASVRLAHTLLPVTIALTLAMAAISRNQDLVLRNYELMDSILDKSDAFTIVVSTSVCRYWREIITSSSVLSRRLALLNPPKYLPRSLATTGDLGGKWQINQARDEQTAWLLRTPASLGTLWVLRIPTEALEIFIVVPNKKRNSVSLQTERQRIR